MTRFCRDVDTMLLQGPKCFFMSKNPCSVYQHSKTTIEEEGGSLTFRYKHVSIKAGIVRLGLKARSPQVLSFPLGCETMRNCKS